MIVSELRLYDFRRFHSIDGNPGLSVSFHKGLNALIGENDSGKTAVIDALKLVLLTQSNDYVRPVEEDFYVGADNKDTAEFRIECVLSEFSQNEAKNFIEFLEFTKDAITTKKVGNTKRQGNLSRKMWNSRLANFVMLLLYFPSYTGTGLSSGEK